MQPPAPGSPLPGRRAIGRAYTDRYDLEVIHNASGNATFRFTYSASLTCTLSGVLEQHGQLYRIPTATYQSGQSLAPKALRLATAKQHHPVE